jgi:hypothetical protein
MVTPITPGEARRLTPADIKAAANKIGCDVATLKAVMAVESRNTGYDHLNRPIILFEPHVFYRNLEGDQRAAAVKAGVAYAKWGTRPYPKGSDGNYGRLETARAINNERAFRSISMGMGQVLGENYRAAGCSSAGKMFVEACESEALQLGHMVNFIIANGLADELRNRQWAAFARRYNGPGYRKNRYDTLLANAYRRMAA